MWYDSPQEEMPMFFRRRPIMARRPRRPILFIIFLLIIVALAFYLGKSCNRATAAFTPRSPASFQV
jgi:hypothetical protein